MPNSRRRRFSVQHDISGRNPSKSSHPENESDFNKITIPNKIINMKSNKRNKIFPNSSKYSPPLDIVTECDSTTTVAAVREQSSTTNEKNDKTVTASSSNIDIANFLTATDDPSIQSVETTVLQKETLPKKREKQTNRDGMPKPEKPRQHRVKVRSPKRRVPTPEGNKSDDSNKQSVGSNAIDWDQEMEVYLDHVTDTTESNMEDDRVSNHSNDDMCRICHGGEALSPDLGQLISACSCRGTVGRVHVKCLERWLTESGKSRCELCGTRYATRRVHRYGVPRALVMWVLSQNAKQLMVDSLGIMLMSPLAILAAWLSGRTLAGLMTQDSHVTPWPLASTFVLACMTLVCYYCWIVSAATRHALGWWIWYRSQYEVRLQFQNADE